MNEVLAREPRGRGFPAQGSSRPTTITIAAGILLRTDSLRGADLMQTPNRHPILAMLIVPCLASWSYSAAPDDGGFLKGLRAGPKNGPGVTETTKVRRKDKRGVEREVEERRSRSGVVARSKRAALVTEDVVELMVPLSPQEAKRFEGTDAATMGSHGSVEYYDESGALKWRKDLSPKKAAMHPRRISDGGEIISVIEGCEINCRDLPLDQPNRQLVVWDSTGNELVRFPRRNGDCDVASSGHWVSGNGNYVMTSCGTKGRIPASIVLDVKRKRIWRSSTLLDVIVSKPVGPRKVLVLTTDEQLKNKTVELDLERLPWEPLE